MANGFTNQGLINLGAADSGGSVTRLYVDSGTLVNAAGGTIETTGALGRRPGAARHGRQPGADRRFPYGLYWAIDRGSGLSTNEGTINLNGVGPRCSSAD